jgi:hypothetical protein
MPSLRRRHSDPHSAGHSHLRSSLANVALAVEDRVLVGGGDLLRGLADAVSRPFERIAWAVEHWLVWPIQEETALWSRATRATVGVALIVLAGGAVAAGIALSNPSQTASKVSTLEGPVAPRVAAAAHHQAAVPKGPVLHGTAPSFAPESGDAAPKSSGSEVLHSEAGGEGAGVKSAEAGAAKGEAGGSASTGPEVAGPAATKVAREFANAFVLYEVGNDSAKVKKAIAATSSDDLTQALLRRPPRLPSNVKVPKARVLNIVPGPTHGSTYTLSVSLLRVGVTSELRLDMKRVAPASEGAGGARQWQVTDALG